MEIVLAFDPCHFWGPWVSVQNIVTIYYGKFLDICGHLYINLQEDSGATDYHHYSMQLVWLIKHCNLVEINKWTCYNMK